MTLSPAPARESTGLQAFAEAVSSASDLELAGWQEQGLTTPSSRTGMVVWSVAVLSVGVGCAVLALFGWFLIRPTLGLAPTLLSPRRSTRSVGLVIILSVMITVIAGGAAAFATFQGVSRLVFDALGHPTSRRGH